MPEAKSRSSCPAVFVWPGARHSASGDFASLSLNTAMSPYLSQAPSHFASLWVVMDCLLPVTVILVL